MVLSTASGSDFANTLLFLFFMFVWHGNTAHGQRYDNDLGETNVFSVKLIFNVSGNIMNTTRDERDTFLQVFANSYNIKDKFTNPSLCDPYGRNVLDATIVAPRFNTTTETTSSRDTVSDSRNSQRNPNHPRAVLESSGDWIASELAFEFPENVDSNAPKQRAKRQQGDGGARRQPKPVALAKRTDWVSLKASIDGSCTNCPDDVSLFSDDVSNRLLLQSFLRRSSRQRQSCEKRAPYVDEFLVVFTNDLALVLPAIVVADIVEVYSSKTASFATFEPTSTPSSYKADTDEPTSEPSYKPSTPSPTDIPTSIPTINAVTEAPTGEPSYQPSTSLPTEAPTSEPTGEPSLKPSTSTPTQVPTSIPTSEPSIQPSELERTLEPTVQRTAASYPTFYPTQYYEPTYYPTSKPVYDTAEPTYEPSYPTVSFVHEEPVMQHVPEMSKPTCKPKSQGYGGYI